MLIVPGIDLHIHSTASDGSYNAREIVELARSLGLKTISITDHDAVDSVEEASKFGKTGKPRVDVIAGIELKVKNEPQRGIVDVEILGYGIDPKNMTLGAVLDKRRESKIRKTEKQIRLIEKDGYELPIGEVKDVTKGLVSRRPHMWEVFQRHNACISKRDFFKRTSFGGGWYVEEDYTLSLEDCIETIKRAGGVAIVAHPGAYNKIFEKRILFDQETIKLLENCVKAGVQGVEVFYPYNKNKPYFDKVSLITKDQNSHLVDYYRKAAVALGIKMTGGSDYHGTYKPEICMGEVDIPVSVLEDLKSLILKNADK